jgi:hypothetical protein
MLKPWIAHGYGMLSKPFSVSDLSCAIEHAVARRDEDAPQNKRDRSGSAA